eukprot:6201548-Pleurochrysis_carterae.AAC.1
MEGALLECVTLTADDAVADQRLLEHERVERVLLGRLVLLERRQRRERPGERDVEPPLRIEARGAVADDDLRGNEGEGAR